MAQKKVYELHENEYIRIRKQGASHWDEGDSRSDLDTEEGIERTTLSSLTHIFSQPWMPKSGSALEFGCGTGPILRWLCRQGFEGVGIEISKTAIEMAQELSEGQRVKYYQGDICRPLQSKQRYDVVIDGHCLHCITAPKDRHNALRNVKSHMKEAGVFVLLSMCAPVNKADFKKRSPDQFLRDETLYAPFSGSEEYEGNTLFDGKAYIPIRHIGHWRKLIDEIEAQGFICSFAVFDGPRSNDCIGSLAAVFLHA
ncbi:MAG: class I SAM-dependent methyltransferase [Planctomycetes bacterium]|nr:class I SAM-dependent methyltransferase [Planctomycetota bacterium]